MENPRREPYVGTPGGTLGGNLRGGPGQTCGSVRACVRAEGDLNEAGWGFQFFLRLLRLLHLLFVLALIWACLGSL